MEERSDDVKKLHHHAILHVNSYIKFKSEIDGFRRIVNRLYPDLKKDTSKYYIKRCADETKYAVYSSKNLNIIMKHGYTTQEIQDILTMTKKINKEKKTKMKSQLLEHFKEYEFGLMTNLFGDIQYEILNYHTERDYLPPSRTLLTQYTAYIIMKNDNFILQQKQYMIKQLYGIIYD